MMGKLWAVARVTIAQGVRMKVALVIIFFLLAVVPALPFLLQTDGTQLGQVRIVVTYSLYLAFFLLSILTLFISTASVNKEIEQKQIFVLDPKPLPRWQIFAGKWLGIMVLNAILVALLGVAAYILIMYLSRPSMGTEKDHADLRGSFLVAREAVAPDLPADIGTLVNQEYDKMKRDGTLPEGRPEPWVKEHLIPIVARNQNSVAPLTFKEWRFSGLPTNLPPDTRLQFRFTYLVSKRSPTAGGVDTDWLIGNYRFVQHLPYDGFHSVEVPLNAIAPDGTITARYSNAAEDGPLVIFPYDNGISIFYPVGSLEMNYFKALLVIYLMLGMLTLVGLVCGALLSFPVAVLVVLVIFSVGLGSQFLSGIIQGTFVFGPDIRQPGAQYLFGDWLTQNILGFILFLFPPLLDYSPVTQVSDAQVIPWGFVFKTFVYLLLIRGGILAAFGAYLFHQRELGTASVQ